MHQVDSHHPNSALGAAVITDDIQGEEPSSRALQQSKLG